MSKIVHLLGSAGIGGTERQLLMLLEEMHDSGFVNEVILFRGGPLESSYSALVPTRVIGKSIKADPLFLKRLVSALRESKPDIVHSWGPTPNLWAPLATKLAGVSHLVASDRELDLWKGPFRRRLDAWLGRVADAVVANAEAVARAAAERGVSEEKLRVIHNGVRLPTEVIHRREDGLILVLARIHPRKGHDIVVEALPKILKKAPNARLVLAGPAALPDEVEFLDYLRRRLQELGIVDKVELHGHVSDTTFYLQRATVLVLASRSEGLPNVLIEAMATGTPVVATAVGGTAEIVEHELTGLLVPPNDSRALAEAISEVLTDLSRATERAARARADIERRFTPAAMARSWAELYNEILLGNSDQIRQGDVGGGFEPRRGLDERAQPQLEAKKGEEARAVP